MNDRLPTASVRDTRQTQQEVGTFRALFLALCPDVCGGDA